MNRLDRVKSRYRTRISTFVKSQIYALGEKSPELADKLKVQFEPSIDELDFNADYVNDPLSENDLDIHPLPSVVHKYPNKMLFLTTTECPVFCRYCMRKRITLLSSKHSLPAKDKLLSYIQSQPNINEVILSGGDPLMLGDTYLFDWCSFFTNIPQVDFLRIHTRSVTTLPSRFSSKFWQKLEAFLSKHPKCNFTWVLHINHVSELSEESIQHIKSLQNLGVLLLCQAVLLKGVNDELKTLQELAYRLFELNIRFYYLHHLDKVEGSAHFHVPIEDGKYLMTELRETIPVYLLPQYVMDSKQGKKALL